MPNLMETPLDLAHDLVARLERLSADSSWAHRASGLRRSLLRCLEEVETGKKPAATEQLAELIHQGFLIIESAARAMGDRE